MPSGPRRSSKERSSTAISSPQRMGIVATAGVTDSKEFKR